MKARYSQSNGLLFFIGCNLFDAAYLCWRCVGLSLKGLLFFLPSIVDYPVDFIEFLY